MQIWSFLPIRSLEILVYRSGGTFEPIKGGFVLPQVSLLSKFTLIMSEGDMGLQAAALVRRWDFQSEENGIQNFLRLHQITAPSAHNHMRAQMPVFGTARKINTTKILHT